MSSLARTATVILPGLGSPLLFEVHADSDKHVSERIATEGVWEPFETALIQRLVGPGALVADCGANIGWYTVVTASLGASVVAFEPMPANAVLLRRNVELNELGDRVEVHQVGLGSRPGRAVLELSVANQGDHRMVAEPSGRKATVEVEIRTLDDILAGRRPDLIKLDTQGSEVAILTGGRLGWAPVDGATAPVIVLEFWPYGLQQCGASVDQLVEMLREIVDVTHRCFEILEWRFAVTPLSLDDLDAMAHVGGYSAEMKGFTNLLLVPMHRVAEIAEFIAVD
jgi:FkbM family methyltransferase